ncbi:MAG: radical SAM protein [Euryarchaeota archaeon]|nr:radical SAM protein [Euryarchaeota archaeon]
MNKNILKQRCFFENDHMPTISILDGYIDEPTCLGVPPYISPYPRYLAGAAWTFDKKSTLFYVTIDQIRKDKTTLDTLAKSDVVVVVAGTSVPGRYLSGLPASPNELVSIINSLTKPLKLLCGPAAKTGFGLGGGKHVQNIQSVEGVFDLIITGDGDIVLSDLLHQHLNIELVDPAHCRSDPHMIQKFAETGAQIVTQHPFYPQYLIAEIETYRGCSRSIVGGCSFCSEPAKGTPSFRLPKDIIKEIHMLYMSGVRHFRIGNQPCLFSYMANDAGKKEFPKPNPDAIEQLFKGIRSIAPNLKTLHIDNVNPGVVARYPKESRRIAKTIIKYHTSGDVAAMGVESTDPIVIKKNNLKASAEEVLKAIRLINEVGAVRGQNGLPELLPGLNFVCGLEGETKNTFKLNYEFLQQVYNEGLLLRRINLRQVIPIPGTKMFSVGDKLIRKHKQEFHRFKRLVRQNIERPLLERLTPKGTILNDLYTELYEGKTTFARQLGSYPLLVGIPGVLPLHTFLDVNIIDYGYRSLTAVPFPLNINTAQRETLESLPSIGKKRVIRILAKRPFTSKEQFLACFDDPEIGKKLLEFVTFT